jgi:hypothetical protein
MKDSKNSRFFAVLHYFADNLEFFNNLINGIMAGFGWGFSC